MHLLRDDERHGHACCPRSRMRAAISMSAAYRCDDDRVFGARVPMRAHGCAVDPVDNDRVLFFARRPGTQAFELRRETLQVAYDRSPPGEGRHLAGHGLFSAAGDLLFMPEHDYENQRGIVSVRDARTFQSRERDRHAWHRSARSDLVE